MYTNNYSFDFDKFLKTIKRYRFLGFLIYLILMGIFLYVNIPIINPIYKESYFLFFLNINIILLFLIPSKINSTFLKWFWGIILGLYILLIFFSSPIINSGKYEKLIGDVQTLDYKTSLPKINENKIPIVDYTLAEKLGDKVLGGDEALGSQYTIGEYYLISTKDDIAWVAPLEPQSFLKWLQHKNGSPGYIYVSATNPNDVRLVQNINGKNIHLKYTTNSYFNNNIKRHAFLNNNFTKGMTDYSFEIDDEGNPYWVISTYKPTIGFSGNDVSGIIIVNAQTGDTKYYDKDDKNIPSWVNRVYPKSLIRDQLTYYGYYKNGWFNSITTQKGMIKPTSSISYVLSDDNIPYYYTGMTSVQNDESTVGFVIVNPINKKTTYYKINGATETAAKRSAEGKVQQFKYRASEPILLTLYNKPTYFSTLKDNDNLVKQYAFISVQNYNIVGIGNNLEEAKTDYYNQLKYNNQLSKSDVTSKKLSGKIERINYIDNKFYLKLDSSDKIFISDKDLSADLVLSQKNDNVSIEYSETKDTYTPLISFNNKDV